MNPDLTLTLGVRYENHRGPDKFAAHACIHWTVQHRSAHGEGPFNQPNQVKRDNNNWIPTLASPTRRISRTGVLGRLFGEKKTVIRSGFNMGYDSFFNNIASNARRPHPI